MEFTTFRKSAFSIWKLNFLVLLLPVIFISNPGSCQEKNWHETTFRKLFFDYHTHAEAWGVGRDFDAEAWAERLKNAHAEGVSVFAKCARGWRYYRKGNTGWVHPKLPEGMDMLGEMVEACKKRNIRVIAYYHTFSSENLAAEHPEWRYMSADGRARGAGICLLTPMMEQHMIPQIEDIVSNYDIDGIFLDGTYASGLCYCPTCRAKFREATGLELPVEDGDKGWAEAVSWRKGEHQKVRQKVIDAVRRIDPHVLVSINWVYSLRQPEVPPENLGYMMIDIFPYNQVFAASYIGKYWATLGTSYDIMNTAFLRWWGDWDSKPAAAMQQECGAILANGGKTWLGFQLNAFHAIDQAVLDEMGKAMKFVEEREEYCRDYSPVPYIAVLHSTKMHYKDKPSFRVDEEPVQALHKMMLENGLHYNFVNEATLLRTINDYRLVILPDQRFLDGELAEAIRQYVRNGGSIIATTLTGTQDTNYANTGTFMLEDVLGVRYAGLYPHTHGYIYPKAAWLKENMLDMPHQAWGTFVYAEPVTAESIAELWDIYLMEDGKLLLTSSPPGKNTGYPGVTLNRFGKGRAAYISGDIFAAYAFRNQWNLKNMFGNLINAVIEDKVIELDAPNMVEVVLTEQRGRQLVHLVNHNGERVLGETIAMTEDIIPIRDIKVTLRVERMPEVVRQMPEDRRLVWKKMDENHITISVPDLDIYSIVTVQ